MQPSARRAIQARAQEVALLIESCEQSAREIGDEDLVRRFALEGARWNELLAGAELGS